MGLGVSLPRVLCLPLLLGSAALAACGTDAVGVEACRQIETARCTAAPQCKGDPSSAGIETEEQVDNCITFYRDQCLHGLENAEDEPKTKDVDRCIAAIEATTSCQKNGAATMAGCEGVTVVEGAAELSPCAVLAEPENLTDCTFALAPEEGS